MLTFFENHQNCSIMLWENSLQNGNFSIFGLFPNSKNYVLTDLKQGLKEKIISLSGDGVQCVKLSPVSFLHFCQEPNVNLHMYCTCILSHYFFLFLICLQNY